VSTIMFFALYLLLRPFLHNHALWLAFLVYLAMRGIVQSLIMRKEQILHKNKGL